jgi:hypothetical protein
MALIKAGRSLLSQFRSYPFPFIQNVPLSSLAAGAVGDGTDPSELSIDPIPRLSMEMGDRDNNNSPCINAVNDTVWKP